LALVNEVSPTIKRKVKVLTMRIVIATLIATMLCISYAYADIRFDRQSDGSINVSDSNGTLGNIAPQSDGSAIYMERKY
jgi:hypothetical protein